MLFYTVFNQDRENTAQLFSFQYKVQSVETSRPPKLMIYLRSCLYLLEAKISACNRCYTNPKKHNTGTYFVTFCFLKKKPDSIYF